MKNSVKVERAKKDWTQEDLANKIEVSRQTIVSIESIHWLSVVYRQRFHVYPF